MQYNRRYIFGEWHEARAPISDTEAREICDKARVRAQAFANCPVESVLRTLKAVGELWADPTYEERRRVREELPHSTGFSQPMIDLALDELPRMLSPDSLGAKLRAELGDIPRLPAAGPGLERGTFRAWHPIGTVFHVLAGNVFLGA
ncbi:MAG: acyl-CoA reductase, partial [Myxococcota bacterium]